MTHEAEPRGKLPNLLLSLDAVLATTLASAAMKPFDVSSNFDPSVDISDIAQRRVAEIKKKGDDFEETLRQWLPKEGDTAIVYGGWSIKSPADEW